MPDTAALKIAIVEDQPKIREGLRILIDSAEGFRCSGSFGSMELALEGIDQDLPDVALVDIGLPQMSGIDGIRLLKKDHPQLAILMLTVYDDDRRIFDALCAGACGYLLKNVPPARLLESLKEVVSGGAPMSPEIARRVVNLFREFRTPERAPHGLTQQEAELLRLMVEGHSYKTAAADLGISVSTVSFHLQNIYGKLQVHSKSEAVAKALRNRIV
jgi:DNA-binding NarL/FixJ family response regulator